MYKQISVLALAVSLASCMGGQNGSVKSGTSYASLTPATIQPALRQAVCEGKAEAVFENLQAMEASPVRALLQGVAYGMQDQYFAAQANLTVAARDGFGIGINLVCENGLRLAGPVSSVAGELLASVNIQVKADEIKKQTTLKKELEAEKAKKKVAAKASSAAKKSPPKDTSGLKMLALKVDLPPSENPNGRFFAHIASYTNFDNLTKYRDEIGKIYPDLRGNVSTWRISTANGPAWRLGVATDDWSDADRLCVSIRSRGEYCKVMER